jgi:hypothetical protein
MQTSCIGRAVGGEVGPAAPVWCGPDGCDVAGGAADGALLQVEVEVVLAEPAVTSPGRGDLGPHVKAGPAEIVEGVGPGIGRVAEHDRLVGDVIIVVVVDELGQ